MFSSSCLIAVFLLPLPIRSQLLSHCSLMCPVQEYKRQAAVIETRKAPMNRGSWAPFSFIIVYRTMFQPNFTERKALSRPGSALERSGRESALLQLRGWQTGKPPPRPKAPKGETRRASRTAAAPPPYWHRCAEKRTACVGHTRPRGKKT